METFVQLWPTLTWAFTTIILINLLIVSILDCRENNFLLITQGILLAVQVILSIVFFITKSIM